jgi:antibiotic biosynthesis monooxygenase (ABM) superfamily enzyme
MQQIKKWKMAILVWVFIYPTITLLNLALGSALASQPLPIKTLVLTIILVPLMVFVALPFITKNFQKWLIK